MRDHPQHDLEIVPGMWGVKLKKANIRSLFADSVEKMFTNVIQNHRYSFAFPPKEILNSDQMALRRFFWYAYNKTCKDVSSNIKQI